MPVSASPGEAGGDEGAYRYADPLPYLDRINEELERQGQDPLFSCDTEQPFGYSLARSFDFRGWPLVGEMPPTEFPDGLYDVPATRIRVIGEREGKLIHACYERVPLPLVGETVAEIARRAMEPLPFKWRVTYRFHSWESCDCPNATLHLISGAGYAELYHEDCGRWRETKVKGPLDEHIESLVLAPPDEIYDGYYPTIPGDDVAHLNPGAPGMDEHRGGKKYLGNHELDNQDRVIDGRYALRGGTEIRGGRAEWKRKTKGMISWDAGTQKDIDKIKTRQTAERKARNYERIAKKLAEAPPSLGWE